MKIYKGVFFLQMNNQTEYDLALYLMLKERNDTKLKDKMMRERAALIPLPLPNDMEMDQSIKKIHKSFVLSGEDRTYMVQLSRSMSEREHSTVNNYVSSTTEEGRNFFPHISFWRTKCLELATTYCIPIQDISKHINSQIDAYFSYVVCQWNKKHNNYRMGIDKHLGGDHVMSIYNLVC